MGNDLVNGIVPGSIDRHSSNGGGGGRQGTLITLRLLGQFDLARAGRTIPLGLACQRMVTLIAVKNGQVNRIRAAGTLWPETTAKRAVSNLRSALWRLQQTCCDVIEASPQDLRIAAGVAVDIHDVSEIAFKLYDRSLVMSIDELKQAMRYNLYEDIAPDLRDDEWLVAERERFRQLRVHALESLAGHLVAAGWQGAAIEVALGAIRADPFRESAYELLIKAHLAEGSRFEARRQYLTYCERLRTELGLTPSPKFLNLLHVDEGLSNTGHTLHQTP